MKCPKCGSKEVDYDVPRHWSWGECWCEDCGHEWGQDITDELMDEAEIRCGGDR